jgi:hypothetical protein
LFDVFFRELIAGLHYFHKKIDVSLVQHLS